jgi:hypothetical protein
MTLMAAGNQELCAPQSLACIAPDIVSEIVVRSLFSEKNVSRVGG